MRTRGMPGYLVAISCLLGLTVSAALAQEADFSTNIDLGYVSKYIWRGTVCNPDPAFQPSVTLSHSSGLSFNFWGSLDTTDVSDNSGSFTENDYTLSYAWAAGGRDMSIGYIYYDFPNTDFESTQEVFYNVGLGGPLGLGLGLNYDFDQANGLYGALSGSYSLKVAESKEVSLTGKLGFATSDYNEYYFGADKAGLVDLVLGASIPLEYNKYTITPSISYSMLVNSDLKDAYADDDTNFIAGLTVSSAF
ncbi:MAG: TorF family putative porin [Armatimonadota bacterium]|nr:hypothetical protein [bacterium]